MSEENQSSEPHPSLVRLEILYVEMLIIVVTSLYVYNKIDSVSLDFLDQLAREPNTVVMSCELDLGIQDVVERCWQELRLMRIYTKRYCHPIHPSPTLTACCTAS